MTTFDLHCAKSLDEQFENLCRSGKKGRRAVEQCQGVLNRIRLEGPWSEALLAKRTKRGEYRISHCVKYRLSHGYRLVTVRRGRDVFILFLGSHDKTDQWLEQNRGCEYTSHETRFNSETIAFTEPSINDRNDCISQSCCEAFDTYEEYLQEQLDDETLRSIFSGLTEVRR